MWQAKVDLTVCWYFYSCTVQASCADCERRSGLMKHIKTASRKWHIWTSIGEVRTKDLKKYKKYSSDFHKIFLLMKLLYYYIIILLLYNSFVKELHQIYDKWEKTLVCRHLNSVIFTSEKYHNTIIEWCLFTSDVRWVRMYILVASCMGKVSDCIWSHKQTLLECRCLLLKHSELDQLCLWLIYSPVLNPEVLVRLQSSSPELGFWFLPYTMAVHHWHCYPD